MTSERSGRYGPAGSRSREAGSLFRSTRLPIAAVALACGFAAQPHMSAKFKQVSGWRRRSFRLPDPA